MRFLKNCKNIQKDYRYNYMFVQIRGLDFIFRVVQGIVGVFYLLVVVYQGDIFMNLKLGDNLFERYYLKVALCDVLKEVIGYRKGDLRVDLRGLWVILFILREGYNKLMLL